MFQRLAMFLMLTILALCPVVYGQVPSMPGPSGTLINAQAATTTSNAFSISGYGVTTFQLAVSNAASGIVTFQGSMDNTNWAGLGCWTSGNTSPISSTVIVASALVSSSVFMSCNTDGIPSVRAVLSPWNTGTFTVNVGTSYMPRAK